MLFRNGTLVSRLSEFKLPIMVYITFQEVTIRDGDRNVFKFPWGKYGHFAHYLSEIEEATFWYPFPEFEDWYNVIIAKSNKVNLMYGQLSLPNYDKLGIIGIDAISIEPQVWPQSEIQVEVHMAENLSKAPELCTTLVLYTEPFDMPKISFARFTNLKRLWIHFGYTMDGGFIPIPESVRYLRVSGSIEPLKYISDYKLESLVFDDQVAFQHKDVIDIFDQNTTLVELKGVEIDRDTETILAILNRNRNTRFMKTKSARTRAGVHAARADAALHTARADAAARTAL